MRIKLLILFLPLFFALKLYSQCGPTVPTFNVNLTGNPSGVWTSPFVQRVGNCCGTVAPDKCVDFIITLDPKAVGISFNIIDGAIPGGALFYQIGCGPPTALGSPICLSGPGPHLLTFCKPGNNENIYQITSVPAAVGGTDITVNDGCVGHIHATGFNTATVTWNSIYPGAPGAYNNYLSFPNGVLNPTVTGSGVVPPYVDYVICGQPAAQCNFQTVCDTVRVTFHPTLFVNILPQNPTICFGQTSTTLTATGSGGTPPYSYLWNSVNTSQSINVGAGNYNVVLSDASGCPPTSASVTVTSFSVAITANAGPDDTICSQSPATVLHGSVTGASGGVWSGGAGTYSPNNATLSGVVYTPTPAELAAGSVTLTLTTTGNGTCPAASDVVKISYMGFTGTIATVPVNVSCFGGNNGSATVSVTGGISPYTYSWNTVPVKTTPTASNLTQGTYTVTMQNGIGCTTQTTVTITQPPPLTVSNVTTNVSCAAGSDGSVTVTPGGGTPPYTYAWAPGGQTTAGISGQTAGTYTVSITDSKGCVLTSNYTITQPPPLAIAMAHTNVSCFSGSNGTATATASGGTASYTFSWAPLGGTAAAATGLPAGTYTVTVTDAKGCVLTNTTVITQPPALTATTSATNETCDYLNNGTATATPGGGTPGYTYLWMPGNSTTASISSLSSGTYTLTVTDTKGCTVTAFATVTQPAPLAVSIINQVNVSCFAGSNGSLTGSPTGGTPNYTYSWSPGGATTATASGLAAGTYTVTVNDNNGCQIQSQATITQPLLPLSVTNTITNVSCAGGNNGSVTVTPAGGTSPYTYLWSGGQTTSGISGQTAGTYTVTVTDSKGCVLTTNYTITQPAPLAITFTHTNVSCFSGSDGTANSTVTGGTAPYSYSWAPSGGTAANATGLQAGTYTLTVTDAKGCVTTNTVVITQPTALTATTSVTNETCDYKNNGTATAIPSGGTAGYTYVWQPGNLTTATISNLASGTYTVTTTDSKGCVITATATITQPAPLAIAFSSQTNVSCFGGNNGAVSATPSGGTPNYTYSWAPGGATTNSVSGLAAGTYTLTITDANTCQGQNTVTITQPAVPLSVSGSSGIVSCFGGSNGTATANGAGGTAPYTYSWMPGNLSGQSVSGLTAGTYTVTATDANSCTSTNTIVVNQPAVLAITFTHTNVSCFSGSDGTATSTVTGGTAPFSYSWAPSGGTSFNATGLQAGTYTLTVTDAKGCIATNTVVITQPTALTATTSVTNETCDYKNNGTATAIPSGGTAGYTYVWQPGNLTTVTISNLASGTYTVTTTDSKGCVVLATATVTQPAPLAIAFSSQTNVSCFGGNNGAVSATPSGGTPNYTYSWAPGGATTNSVSGLAAGTYTLTITDANTCQGQNTVTITQPAVPLSVSGSSGIVSCFGGSNGTATANGAGGTAPYTYSWMPGNLTGQSVSGLTAGTYTVTATDANSCTSTNTIVVNQPAVLAITFTHTNVSCFSGSDGTANSTVTGGTAPFSYSWAPSGGTSFNATGLQAGTYTLTVTDAKGCIATNTVVITQPTALTATTSVTNETCDYKNNGTATAIPSGGTAGYTYVWQPGNLTTVTISNLASGTYTVTTTDSKGCVVLATATVTQPAPIAITFNPITNVSCFGGNNGSANAVVTGGTLNYSYSWSPGGSTSNAISGLVAGTYTLTVTDGNTCQGQNTVTITQPALPLTVSGTSTPTTCFEGSNGTATANGAGGTGPYTYTWMPGSLSGQSVSGITAGTYTVTATDNNSCASTNTIVVNQPPAMVLTTSSINSNCGTPSGQASVSVSGGSPPYTYLWSPSGGTASTATGLLSAPYTVYVTDANNCTSDQWVNVNDNTGPNATIFSIIDVTCNGGSDGAASVGVSGGIGPFTYNWTPTGGNSTTATGLTAGTYTVTVVDNTTGCQSHATTSPDIMEPPPIVIGITDTPVSCFGGSDGTATSVVSGGSPGYAYKWLPSGDISSSTSGLTAGTFTLEITDSHSCVQTATYTVTQPAATLSVAVSATPVSCFNGANGTSDAVASGGTGPYNYTWTPGNISGPSIGGLVAGTYTVTVSDSKGCSITATTTVTQPTAVVLATGSINAHCGTATGLAYVSPSGGTAPYTYFWTPVSSTNDTAFSLFSGTYSVTVTDNNSCAASASVVVNETPGPVISITSTTNVSCFGGSNGSASTSVVGGIAPLTYSWTPSGGSAATGTGLIAGTYIVNVTDNNGCSSADTTIVTQPTPVAVTVTTTNVSCFAGNNGTANASASGGTPGYTYKWLPSGSTGPSISGLAVGTYTVEVKDLNNCIQTSVFTITQPVAALSVTASATPASCFNGSNGTATAVASGGTSPYNYSWVPGTITGSTIGGLAAGTYTVNVSDLNGCTATTSTTVTQPTPIALVTGSNNAACGTATGLAYVTSSGGTSPYTYSWLPGGSVNDTAFGLFPGVYNVVVTDNNSCTATISVSVNNTPGPVATITSTTNVSCFGGNNGSSTVSLSGGTAPFSYNWSPSGGSGSTANGLVAGTYTVSVSDVFGCISADTTIVTQPTLISIALTSTNVSCFAGTDGTASASASGGTPGYSYKWLPSGSTGSSISGLAAGTYTIEVTDNNNCVQTSVFTITQPSAALAVSVSTTPVSCFSGSNGTATAIASGGTGPYNYSWMPGSITGPVIGGLAAGTYTVNVIDSKGCTTTNGTAIVTQPTVLSLATGSINAHCGTSTGTAYVTASGGTVPYNYLWSPVNIANDTASGLLSGTYSVTVTDNNTCTASATVTVNETPGPVATITSTTNVSCFGGNNGSSIVSVAGGVPPLSYNWQPSGGNGPTGTGLIAGTYTVTVTDGNGCSSADTTIVTQPPAITINVVTTNVNCFGGADGTATATAFGGTPGYAYKWLPSGSTGNTISTLTSGTFTVQVTDTNACVQTTPFTITQPTVLSSSIVSTTSVSCFGGNNGTAVVSAAGGTPFYSFNWLPYGGTNDSASGLAAGTYTVNITDANSCSTSITVTITEPALALSASGTGSMTSCFGGSDGTGSVSVSGGTPSYTYAWSPSGSGATANGLNAGTYTILVTDSKGCQANTSLIITEPTPITDSLFTVNPSCGFANGSVSSLVSGGTGPYTYAWLPGGATTPNITNVGAGNYSLVITDANSCTSSISATLTNIPGPNVSISSVTNVSCFGGNDGAAIASVSSGTPPFTYSWGPYGGNSDTASFLSIGTYTVTVTDSLGCVNTATALITQPSVLGISVSSVAPVSCFGGSNGAITVTGTGGTPGYSYSWAPVTSTSPSISGLVAGSYTVNVTDSHSCTTSISIAVTEPATLITSIGNSTNVSCYSGYNGTAFATVSGGTLPYSYLWTDGQTGSTAMNLAAGSYSVTVTDFNGCTATSNVLITQPTQVITSSGGNDTICSGSSGTLTSTAVGGAGNYYYVWQPGPSINSGTLNVSPAASTTYTVIAYDQNGCAGTSDTLAAIVYHLTGANIDAIAYSPICPGQSSAVYVQTSGVTGPLTYSWNNNLGTGPGAYLVTPTSPITYVVSVTNSCGATITDSVSIVFNPPPTIVMSPDINSLCAPGTVHFTDNSITGNVTDPITSWLWNFGDGTSSNLSDPSHTYGAPGNYPVTLTITTSAGCTNNNASAPVVIGAHPYPVASFSINSTLLDLPYDLLITNNQSVGASTYYWTFGDGGTSTEVNPQYQYTTVGIYPIQMIATTAYNCSDTAYSQVTTDADVVFPNVFTPDVDGSPGGIYDITSLTNDIFFPYTSGVTDYKLQIFNRWGELIFETFDIKEGWDGYYRGKLCEQDVYIWKAYLKLNNGREFNKTGDVTLLR